MLVATLESTTLKGKSDMPTIMMKPVYIAAQPFDVASVIDKRSLVDLQARFAIITQVIREAQADGDERWKILVPQQRKLNGIIIKKLQKRREQRGIPEPSPVIIGVQPACLASRTLRP